MSRISGMQAKSIGVLWYGDKTASLHVLYIAM